MSIQVLTAREVPLGGLRAIDVRRTLPHRDRSFIGAWCFVDHYGPQPVAPDGEGGMDVAPHPHTGLQTVSWLFEGEVEHRDSAGVVAAVRPGEANFMTAGAGICHSEVSTAATTTLHGVQLWVALPDSDRHTARDFYFHQADPVELPGGAGVARVFAGELPDVGSSPVRTYTPLLGAQLDLRPNARLSLTVDPSYEHGILVDRGEVEWDGVPLAYADLGCRDEGPDRLELTVGPEGARLILLGGEPFTEEIIMWWNFVGRTHDEIAAYRQEWQDEADRFGAVQGYVGEIDRIPAPAIPGVRLRPRGRRGKK